MSWSDHAFYATTAAVELGLALTQGRGRGFCLFAAGLTVGLWVARGLGSWFPSEGGR